MSNIQTYPQLLVKLESAIGFVNEKINTLKNDSQTLEQNTENFKLISSKFEKVEELMQNYLTQENKFKLLYNRSNDLRLFGEIPRETDAANDAKIQTILNLKSASQDSLFDSKSIIAFFLNLEVIARNLNKVEPVIQYVQFGYGSNDSKNDVKNIQLFTSFKNLWMSVVLIESELKANSTKA